MQYAYIELSLPRECGEDILQPGDASLSVDIWMNEAAVKRQLDQITPDQARIVLEGYGAWEGEELEDHRRNIERILWLAGCDLGERLVMGEADPDRDGRYWVALEGHSFEAAA